MHGVVLGKETLLECARCEGLWSDAASLNNICSDREQQAAVLGVASHLTPEDENDIEKVRYVPCPYCNKLMNRVNFAKCSHVIVDVCLSHGTWFDKDELRRIVEFIRGGGMEKARQMEIADLEYKRRSLEAAQEKSRWDPDYSFGGTSHWPGGRSGSLGIGVSAAAAMLKGLFR